MGTFGSNRKIESLDSTTELLVCTRLFLSSASDAGYSTWKAGILFRAGTMLTSCYFGAQIWMPCLDEQRQLQSRMRTKSSG